MEKFEPLFNNSIKSKKQVIEESVKTRQESKIDKDQKPKLERMGVSLVICSYNGEKKIPLVLNELKKQKVNNVSWEIIIIDNDSTDNTSDIVKKYQLEKTLPIKFFRELKPGKTNAQRKALSKSKYEIISFLDDDNLPCNDWIEKVSEIFFKNPKVGVCGSKSYLESNSIIPFWFKENEKYYAVGSQGKRGDVTQENDFLWGAGMSIRKSAWKQILKKGFKPILPGRPKESLMYGGEDLEICFALKLAGWKLYYDPSLFIKHIIYKDRLNLDYLCRLKKSAGFSSIIFDLYLYFLKKPSNPFRRFFKKNWLAQFIVTFLLIKKDEFLLKIKKEKHKIITDLCWRKGKLEGLIKNRKNHKKRFKEIKNAKWL